MERRSLVNVFHGSSTSPEKNIDHNRVHSLSFVTDVAFKGNALVHFIDDLLDRHDRCSANFDLVRIAELEELFLCETSLQSIRVKQNSFVTQNLRHTIISEHRQTVLQTNKTTIVNSSKVSTNHVDQMADRSSFECSPNVGHQDLRSFVETH